MVDPFCVTLDGPASEREGGVWWTRPGSPGIEHCARAPAVIAAPRVAGGPPPSSEVGRLDAQGIGANGQEKTSSSLCLDAPAPAANTAPCSGGRGFAVEGPVPPATQTHGTGGTRAETRPADNLADATVTGAVPKSAAKKRRTTAKVGTASAGSDRGQSELGSGGSAGCPETGVRLEQTWLEPGRSADCPGGASSSRQEEGYAEASVRHHGRGTPLASSVTSTQKPTVEQGAKAAATGAATLASTLEPGTRKQKRHKENEEAPGGMRSPWRYVSASPAARRCGIKVAVVLEEFICEHPQVIGWLLDEGQVGHVKYSAKLEKKLVARLCQLLGAKTPSKGRRSKWRAELVRAYLKEAEDPERHLPDWLENGVPTGVQCEIPASGIFPRVETHAEATSELWRHFASSGEGRNYKSADENAAAFSAEVERLVKEGYITKYPNLEALEAKLGKVIISKVAAIVKKREDGSEKLRIIIDMLRSCVNTFVKLSERIVLPRLMDIITDVLALMKAMAEDGLPGEEISFMALDFMDAFHSLGVREEEMPYQVFRLPNGGFGCYETAVFGGGGSPLTWGRGAAFLGRSGQALFDPRRARIQIYVDDPLSMWRGSVPMIRGMKCQLLLWWLAVGLGISWPKMQHGSSVKWIGAIVSLRPKSAVCLSLPEEYLLELQTEALELGKTAAAPARRLRQLAGKATWAAGFIPAIGAMVAPIWAAASGHSKAGADGDLRRGSDGDWLVPTKRVAHALNWLVAFTKGKTGCLIREFRREPYDGPPAINMEFDASPWGYGAVLYVHGRPKEFFGLPISREDIARFGIVIGDHRFQTLCENLAILIGVRHWLPRWRLQRLQVMVKSDSLSALGAWGKERSRSTAVNAVVREAALDMAEGLYRIDVRQHIEGVSNIWPDALSRLLQPNTDVCVPPELHSCTRAWPARRVDGWWRADGPF